jgi:hypothetical protein
LLIGLMFLLGHSFWQIQSLQNILLPMSFEMQVCLWLRKPPQGLSSSSVWIGVKILYVCKTMPSSVENYLVQGSFVGPAISQNWVFLRLRMSSQGLSSSSVWIGVKILYGHEAMPSSVENYLVQCLFVGPAIRFVCDGESLHSAFHSSSVWIGLKILYGHKAIPRSVENYLVWGLFVGPSIVFMLYFHPVPV